MKLSLKINDNPCEIEANALSDSTYSIVVNGQHFQTRIDSNTDEDFEITVNDKSHKIIIGGPVGNGAFEVNANGKCVQVESINTRSTRHRTASTTEKSGEQVAAPVTMEPGAIVAPMPGTVVTIDKKSGDNVEQGEKIMTIEAMKMENEICAQKSGVVKEIRVSPGSSVKAKAVLAIIE